MDTQTISQCLEVIKWQRYREGSYSSLDPLLAIQDKLRRMRDSKNDALTKAELLMLLKANSEGIQHIKRRPHLPETLETATKLTETLRAMVLEVPCAS